MGSPLDNCMLRRFTEWLRIREAVVGGPQITPAQQTAQDMTTDALQKMPLKPGQNPADMLSSPKGQTDLLAKTNQMAKAKGKPLNIGAAANAMDAAKAQAPAPGM